METLEIHSKDYLVKWIHAPENSVIDWQAKPLKKSINFAIYCKNEEIRGNDSNGLESETNGLSGLQVPNSSFATSNGSSMTRSGSVSSQNGSGRIRSASVVAVNQYNDSSSSIYKSFSRSTSALSNNISTSDLTLVKDYKKLISNELVHGKFEVKKEGVYAFIFDNSFSKNFSKKVLFSTKLETRGSPTSTQVVCAPILPKKTTKDNLLRPKNGELLQGTLLKRRRKKLQGFTKRFFVLNFKYGTLSYFKENDNKLRGQMPINQSIISVNAQRREIIIDSGMEAWDLKTLDSADFTSWVEAFDMIKKKFFGQLPNSISQSRRGSLAHEIGEETCVPKHVIQELSKISEKLTKAKKETYLIDEVSQDMEKLLQKLHVQQEGGAGGGELINPYEDEISVQSVNDFYDAQTYLDTTNSGVVFMNELQSSEEDINDALSKESTSSSAGSGSANSSIVEEKYDVTKGSTTNITNDHDDDMYPLPVEPVARECDIPVCTHSPPSILSFLRKNIGKDLSQVAMPVTMNEPIGTLQKYCEIFEYCQLIDNAIQANCDDSTGERILRIASFAVTGLSSMRAKERNIRKPFTPLLGETYELVREDMGIRIISEKVSHKPVVYASFIEHKDWYLTFNAVPEQKFWGKTVEIITRGASKLTIKATGETFSWNQPNTMLKNIIAGEKYGEPVGSIVVKSTSGYKAVVEFAKAGMFSGRSEELNITAYDPSKNELPYKVSGKWSHSLTLKTNTTERQIWTVGKLIDNAAKRFGLTEFAGTLNTITKIEKGKIPPSDSRLRPDLRLYERGDVEKAEELKNKLELEQRIRRKENEESNTAHKVMFFEHVDDGSQTGEWVYKRGKKSYWNRREHQDWGDLLKLW